MTVQSNEIKKDKSIKNNLPIIFILIVSAFLNIMNIWNAGFANKYYAAGVYSMGQNLHAFLFNSFDSVGYITIDKPPLGFWIQVLFTKIFGFSGTVLILPEAIASVISVYVLYRIISKRFSQGAGLIGAAVLALTPIYAAVSRNNTIDSILILLLLLAAAQAMLATEKSSMKHLIFAGIFIGLGFNVKMLQAFVIVPAIYLTFLVFAKQKFIKKILICALSVVIMLTVSLSWVLAVDAVPEENRPYIGSSDTNSALNLALGYNGISRVINLRTLLNKTNDDVPESITQQNDGFPEDNARLNQQPARVSGASSGELGDAGILRMFSYENAGQIAWFILPCSFSVILMLWLMFKRKFKANPKNIAFFFFALSFIPIFIYFSFSSGVSHRYYFATLAPFIAGLAGVAYYYLAESKKYWFVLIFIPTALAQLYIQWLYKDWFSWLLIVAAVAFAAAAVIMIALSFSKGRHKKSLTILLCALLILPAVWSATPLIYSDNSQLPIAGPELTEENDRFDKESDLSGLIEYLEQNRDGALYLAMTPSSMNLGAELILQSGEPVMALGGFNGGDSPLTIEEFAQMVEDGEIKYVVMRGDQNANQEIFRWIKNHSRIVRPIEYDGFGMNITVVELG